MQSLEVNEINDALGQNINKVSEVATSHYSILRNWMLQNYSFLTLTDLSIFEPTW